MEKLRHSSQTQEAVENLIGLLMLRRRLGLRTVLKKERVRLALIDGYIKVNNHYTILEVIAKWLSICCGDL
jgi:hypothetical protein